MFRQEIEFQIHEIALLRRGKIGLRACVRDYPNLETIRSDFRDSETDAVDGDRALFYDVVGEFTGQNDFHPQVGSALFQGEDRDSAIDVSLDKMTADPSIRSQGLLDINEASASQRLQIRSLESLLEEIECEFVFLARSDRETATVYRNARADLRFPGNSRRRYLQALWLLARRNGRDFANFFDQPGEHA